MPPSPRAAGSSSNKRSSSGWCRPWPPAGWSTSPARTAGTTPPPTWAGSPPSTAPGEGLRAHQRRVLPLAELRADFSVARDELRDIDRGAADPDLRELDAAARRIAEAENVAVFHGWAAAGIVGIAEGEGLTQIPLGSDVERYPRHVAKAVETLLSIGISGPYGLALGPDGYTSLVETTEHGGLIVFDHLRQILGGPIVWAPGRAGRRRPEPAGRRLRVRGRRRTCRSATTTTTPTTFTSTWRRASPSGRHPGGGGRPHPVGAGPLDAGNSLVEPLIAGLHTVNL